MSIWIEDLNGYQIYITNLVQEWYVPKFDLSFKVEEPNLTLYWSDLHAGPSVPVREMTINYMEVADGYAGYIDNPSSAQDLKNQLEAMILSGFSAGGDLLNAAGDLLTNNGVNDTILPVGTNEYILAVNTALPNKINWVPNLGTRQKQLSMGTIAHSPLDSTTYYWGGPAQQPVNGAIQVRRKARLNEQVPATITECYFEMLGTSGGGTTENIDMYIQVNGTTDYLIQTTGFPVGSYTCLFANAAMSVPIGVNDWFVFKMDTPAWAVNPAQVYYSGKVVYTV